MEVYYAVVINNNDPSKTGRVQIKICGEHDQTSDLSTLPWADVMQSATFGLVSGVGVSSVLKKGSWVYVIKLNNTEDRYLVLGVCTGISGEEQLDGFADPDKKYPLAGTEGLSDFGHCSVTDSVLNNKAQNDSDKTTHGVGFKYENTVTPNKYLDTTLYRSESGIMIEIDDKDERFKITHPLGNVVEINNDGITITSLKNVVLNVKSDVTVNVKGNYNLNVDGDYNVDIKGNSNTKITQNCKDVINGSKTIRVRGDTKFLDNSSVFWNVDSSVAWNVGSNINFDCYDGLIKSVNVITKQGVNLDKHVHSGVDRGRSDTDKAEDSV